MTFPEDVDSVLDELRTMLIEKNVGYGNSALEPIRIFSKADNLEQIHPIPNGYLAGLGFSGSHGTSIKKYREYLFREATTAKSDPDPDRAYRPFLNTNTRPNREEEKIEGSLEE